MINEYENSEDYGVSTPKIGDIVSSTRGHKSMYKIIRIFSKFADIQSIEDYNSTRAGDMHCDILLSALFYRRYETLARSGKEQLNMFNI